ncbi:MAG: hypothetical protein Q9170_005588 [Blastenia crenularia]
MAWSTDGPNYFNKGYLGPDGPWQAIRVSVGAYPVSIAVCEVSLPPRISKSDQVYNISFVWPSGTSDTDILLADGGGNYTALNATRPEPVYSNSSSNAPQGIPGESDDWGGSYISSEWSSGELLYDKIYLELYPDNSGGLNASIVALSEWVILFPNGRNYTAPAGILGLGPSLLEEPSPSLLEQLKKNGTITSMFCGLHMGSALFQQPGSLILGGYEQNRVLGDVATLNLEVSSSLGGPQAFILDVSLDVEIGDSPFNQSGSISLWHGLNDSSSGGASQSQTAGGRTGSRLVNFNPSVPYMYMPIGICETAAQYLPVNWDSGLDLYIWDMGDQFSRIVSSPALMTIGLADNQANNISIKVPFQVLNLTLLPPIVDAPTQYFPCKPWNQSTGSVLGRAFLQAAFLGFEYENNAAFLAQAPGPSMEQSVIKTFQPNDAMIAPNKVGTFASSWASTWTVLASNASTASPPNNATASSQSTSTSTSDGKGDLSGGAKAGVAVGSVAGALLLAVAAAILIWRRKQKVGAQGSSTASHDSTQNPQFRDQSVATNGDPPELDHWTKPSEAYGNAPPHEMPPDGVHEAPHQRDPQELPIDRPT